MWLLIALHSLSVMAWTSISVDLNLTDGNAHRVAAYFVDWDSGGARSERVDLLDSSTNAIPGYTDAQQFPRWPIPGLEFERTSQAEGHASVRCQCVVMSGLFFGLATSAATATFLKRGHVDSGRLEGNVRR